jgi:hypothetical protein
VLYTVSTSSGVQEPPGDGTGYTGHPFLTMMTMTSCRECVYMGVTWRSVYFLANVARDRTYNLAIVLYLNLKLQVHK